MKHIRIYDNSWMEVTRKCDNDDEWDRDDTAITHSIQGFSVLEGAVGYGDLLTSLKEIKLGKPYFLVYVLYDTGDSFGRDDGQIEYINLFESEDLAEELVRKIEDDSKNEAYNSIEYTLDNGETREFYNGAWKGYFEWFHGAYVERVYREDD